MKRFRNWRMRRRAAQAWRFDELIEREFPAPVSRGVVLPGSIPVIAPW